MNEPMSIDPRPDPEFGAALRAALEPGFEAVFEARFRAALAADSPFEVLARWVWPGLAAAAAALVLAVGAWATRPVGSAQVASLEDTFPADGVEALVAAADRPTRDLVLTAAFGGEGGGE
jgi:hypothetical protein